MVNPIIELPDYSGSRLLLEQRSRGWLTPHSPVNCLPLQVKRPPPRTVEDYAS
jgi:hypothetical protein